MFIIYILKKRQITWYGQSSGKGYFWKIEAKSTLILLYKVAISPLTTFYSLPFYSQI